MIGHPELSRFLMTRDSCWLRKAQIFMSEKGESGEINVTTMYKKAESRILRYVEKNGVKTTQLCRIEWIAKQHNYGREKGELYNTTIKRRRRDAHHK